MNDKIDDREIDYDIMIEQATKDLATAKKNTQTLLDEPNASIDMHGLEYWAGRVETLREFIKNNL